MFFVVQVILALALQATLTEHFLIFKFLYWHSILLCK